MSATKLILSFQNLLVKEFKCYIIVYSNKKFKFVRRLSLDAGRLDTQVKKDIGNFVFIYTDF